MKKAIVCVDDEQFVLRSLKNELEESFGDDYLIETAETGEDTKHLFSGLIKNNFNIDVAIVDYIMPGIKGDELLEHIHKESPDTKGIMLTGQATTEGIKNAINKAGLYRFLTKPWSHDDIYLTVSEAIRSNELSRKVTEYRNRLEIANQKLVQLDKSKNYFLGLLSHELNTPITGISGFTELLRTSLSDPELVEYCDNIMLSTKRLKKFSEYSILITSLMNKKYELQCYNQSIHEIIDEGLFNLNDKIKEKGISLVKEYKYEKTGIELDPNLIEKVIKIVLENAVRFSPENDNIYLNDCVQDNYLKIEITDNGPGFSKDALANIFKLFTSDELQSHQEGLGLGLATAKIIMDIHFGKIQVKNAEDKGAVVSLLFKMR